MNEAGQGAAAFRAASSWTWI
ncbi:MAG: hypothetical protein QOF48_3613, partial [Verrucomicrobiota bacterium]